MDNAGRSVEFVPPSRVARMAAPSPRARHTSTAEAVATARRSEYSSGGSILPVLTPTNSVNASKRGNWVTTPRPSNDSFEDDPSQSTDTSGPPLRRAEDAAARRSETIRQRPTDTLFASEAEQSQLAYMEQMYGTINLLNAELEHERRSRAALEAATDGRPAPHPLKQDYDLYEEDVSIPYGEFDEPPSRFVVSETPVVPSYSPRKLRTMPNSQPQPPSTQHRVAQPPVSPRSIARGQDEELCATLGKNAELRIRSRDMERAVEKTELELEFARKQIKMTERRAENREEKLRELLKEKLQWQKELKATRAQVVEEKMRQVDLFREVDTAKRQFAAKLEAVEQDQRSVQEENVQLRSQANEMRAQLNFQARKMEDMVRQAQDDKERFVALVEDTRRRFREWKEGEATALEAAREQAVRSLKTEYGLKIERHQDEKQKLRDKVNDLEVSMRLLQKDRMLSPLELSLRKTTILGDKDNTGIVIAEQIETQSRILELENLLAHSQEYQTRQEAIIKLSESTISRLMQEREVTALENLSLHPLGMEPQRFRPEDNLYDAQFSGFAAASSPVRRGTPPVAPSRNRQHRSELPVARSPRSRAHTPRRGDLEASISSASPSSNEFQSASPPVDSATKLSTTTGDAVPTTRELELMEELAQLRKELAEGQTEGAQPAPSNVDGVEGHNNVNVSAHAIEMVVAPTTSCSASSNLAQGEGRLEPNDLQNDNNQEDMDKEPSFSMTNDPVGAPAPRCDKDDSCKLEDTLSHENSSKPIQDEEKVSCQIDSQPAGENLFTSLETTVVDSEDLEEATLAIDNEAALGLANADDKADVLEKPESLIIPLTEMSVLEEISPSSKSATASVGTGTEVGPSDEASIVIEKVAECSVQPMEIPTENDTLIDVADLENNDNAPEEVVDASQLEIPSDDCTLDTETKATAATEFVAETGCPDAARAADIDDPVRELKEEQQFPASSSILAAIQSQGETAKCLTTLDILMQVQPASEASNPDSGGTPLSSSTLDTTCVAESFVAIIGCTAIALVSSSLQVNVPSKEGDITVKESIDMPALPEPPIDRPDILIDANATKADCNEPDSYTQNEDDVLADEVSNATDSNDRAANAVAAAQQATMDESLEDMSAVTRDLTVSGDYTANEMLRTKELAKTFVEEVMGNFDNSSSRYVSNTVQATPEAIVNIQSPEQLAVESQSTDPENNSREEEPLAEGANCSFDRDESKPSFSTTVVEADQLVVPDQPVSASSPDVLASLLIETLPTCFMESSSRDKCAELQNIDDTLDDSCSVLDEVVATGVESDSSGKADNRGIPCDVECADVDKVEVGPHMGTEPSQENLNDLTPNFDTSAMAKEFVDGIETKALSTVVALQNGYCMEEANATSNQEKEKFESESHHSVTDCCTPTDHSNTNPVEAYALTQLMSETSDCCCAVTGVCFTAVDSAVSETEGPSSIDRGDSCTHDIASTVAGLFASQLIAEVVFRLSRYRDNNNAEGDMLNSTKDSGLDNVSAVEAAFIRADHNGTSPLQEVPPVGKTLPVDPSDDELEVEGSDAAVDQLPFSAIEAVKVNDENIDIPKSGLSSVGTANEEETIVSESTKGLVGTVITHMIANEAATPHINVAVATMND